MSAIHTKLTGKEDSYEQAVREAGEAEQTKSYQYKPDYFGVTMRLSEFRQNLDRDFENQKQKSEEMLQSQLLHPETMTPNHPDYMRLVVHQMD